MVSQEDKDKQRDIEARLAVLEAKIKASEPIEKIEEPIEKPKHTTGYKH